jgi:hypothetical protein
VLGIALNPGGAAVFNGDQDAAGIRAVVRAGGVDDALHKVTAGCQYTSAGFSGSWQLAAGNYST